MTVKTKFISQEETPSAVCLKFWFLFSGDPCAERRLAARSHRGQVSPQRGYGAGVAALEVGCFHFISVQLLMFDTLYCLLDSVGTVKYFEEYFPQY